MNRMTKILCLLLLGASITTGHARAQAAPDPATAGATVVFRGESAAEQGWFAVPLRGGTVTSLAVSTPTSTAWDYGAWGAAWAPNGKTFVIKPGSTTGTAYGTGSVLTAIGAPAGTPVTRLTDGSMGIPWMFSVSPDSRTAVFVGNDPTADNLFTVPLAGGPPARLTAFPEWSDLNSPSWSPDGTQIAFLQYGTDPATGATQGQLRAVATAGGAQRTVLGGVVTCCHLPSWSPDARTIATVSEAGDVLLVEAASGAARALTSGRSCDHPIFSPSGATVAALCYTPDFSRVELLLFDVATGAPSVYANDAAWDNMGASWAPDGNGVVYITDNGRGWRGVAHVDLAGTPRVLVPPGERFGFISTVMAQPRVQTPTLSISAASLDYVADRITVQATSSRSCSDAMTLLGYGPMTCNRSTRRWSATAPAQKAWESVGVCGIDGCVYLY